MADDRDDDRPQYTVYRSRKRLLGKRDDDPRDEVAELRGDRNGAPKDGRPDYQVHRAGGGRRFRLPGLPNRGTPRPRRKLSVGRVLGYLALAAATWVLVSALLFMVSAQIQSAKVSDAADAQLSGAGFTLTSPNTVLVLGSDARAKGSKEPGATFVGQASRSDSILLMRVGGGSNASLSIPRDTVVDIPGHGRNKINAAYAIGGPALAIKTVEAYLGIDVNHLVEVNFENFPALIDALGGVTYKGGCVVSQINGGTRNGGYTLRLRAGEHEIDGKQALALARTRKNECAKREDDRTRARRQQKILGAIRDKVISLETFVRLPWVSWAAPQAVRSDMAGPSLLGLVGAEVIGGSAKARVLKPSGGVTLPDGGAALVVDDAEKQREVDRFLKG
jgi:LCP family protein required for cell wall assembly